MIITIQLYEPRIFDMVGDIATFLNFGISVAAAMEHQRRHPNR